MLVTVAIRASANNAAAGMKQLLMMSLKVKSEEEQKSFQIGVNNETKPCAPDSHKNDSVFIERKRRQTVILILRR